MNQLVPARSVALVPEDIGQAMKFAELMASAKMVPAHLQKSPADCLQVIMQSARWGMDPFAVAQCISVVHGKLCYEGKLVAAVLDVALGIKLEYELIGKGDQMSVIVSATDRNGKVIVDSKGRPKTVKGTVGEWKTHGNGSPWAAPGGQERMLRYRGAREWHRVHEPSIMLGVYGQDEMEEAPVMRRPAIAANVMIEHVDQETGEVTETAAVDVPHAAAEAAPSPPDGESETGAADPGPDPTLKFIEDTKMSIREFDNPQKLTKWWNSDAQKTARIDYEITKEQSEELRNLVVARRDELMKGEAA